MSQMPTHSGQPIFQTNGPLDRNSVSYVVRDADTQILEYALDGELVKLVTPHHMGKTSLLKRACRSLEAREITCIYIDLRSLTGLRMSDWYKEFGKRIGERLTSDDPPPSITNASALGSFIRRQLISVEPSNQKSVVLMLDSIEAVAKTLRLNDSTSFFATWRALYNDREQLGRQLAVVLAGVANPSTLIRSRDGILSPFGVGRNVDLDDFTKDQTRLLVELLTNLNLQITSQVVSRVHYWTNGSPYLVQRICLELERQARQSAIKNVDEDMVDDIVNQVLLHPDPLNFDPNIEYLRNSLKHFNDQTKHTIRILLNNGRLNKATINSEDEFDLWLSGITRRVENSKTVAVRNEIYKAALGKEFLDRPTKQIHLQKALIGALSCIAIGALLMMLTFGWPTQYAATLCAASNLRVTTEYPRFLATGDTGTVELTAHNMSSDSISTTLILEFSSNASAKASNLVEFLDLEPNETRRDRLDFDRVGPPHWFWDPDAPITFATLVTINGFLDACDNMVPPISISSGPFHALNATWLWLSTAGVISWLLLIPVEWVKELVRSIVPQRRPD